MADKNGDLAKDYCELAYRAIREGKTEVGLQLLVHLGLMLDTPVQKLASSIEDPHGVVQRTRGAVQSNGKSATKRVFTLLSKTPGKDFSISQMAKLLPMCTRSSIQSACSHLQRASYIQRMALGMYRFSET